MTVGQAFLADASVVVKWLVDDEPRTEEARSLLGVHLQGASKASILDVTLYEVGNAMVSKGIWGADMAALMDQLLMWELGWISLTDAVGARKVSEVVGTYELSFYDASYLAAAILHDLPLVTDDAALFEAANAEGVGIDLSSVTPV